MRMKIQQNRAYSNNGSTTPKRPRGMTGRAVFGMTSLVRELFPLCERSKVRTTPGERQLIPTLRRRVFSPDVVQCDPSAIQIRHGEGLVGLLGLPLVLAVIASMLVCISIQPHRFLTRRSIEYRPQSLSVPGQSRCCLACLGVMTQSDAYPAKRCIAEGALEQVQPAASLLRTYF